jgi:hypothetical protein
MAIPTPSLDGVTLKLERAKKHLRDLELASEGFFKTNPYMVSVNDNPEAGKRQHTVTRADPLPGCIPLIAGDVIHNARSALDHLIRQLIIANNRNPEDPKYSRAAFTVWRSEAAYKANRPGDAKGISQAALDVYYGLKPYKGGNDALWRIHQLDIVDKHRLLLTIAAAHRNVIIDFANTVRKLTESGPDWMQDVPSMPLALIPADRPVIAPGVVLFGAPLGDDANDDVKITIQIALSEPQVVEGEPVIPTLSQLIDYVEQVVALFAPLI